MYKHATTRHGKRTTVNIDDVFLVCRRNQSLLKLIKEEAEKLKIAKEQARQSEGKKKGKMKELPTLDEDDDDLL